MHATLAKVKNSLESLVTQVQGAVPAGQAFSVAHNNWSFPGLTQEELVERAQSLIALIDSRGGEDIVEGEQRLAEYIPRLKFLRTHTVQQLWGNANQAVSAYTMTLDGLRAAIEPTLARDHHTDNARDVRKLTAQIRSMEARLNALEPRTTGLSTMVELIERAYEAADQLPSDLEALAEARKQVVKAVEDSSKELAHLLSLREKADGIDVQLTGSSKEATAVLSRCEDAYSAATSKGLAAAFAERSSQLAMSMWTWVVGLIAALGVAGFVGANRLASLAELATSPNANGTVIVVNLLLSTLSVAAPVWFAWLATKQIGQRFRLAEDYAFKASVSRAYEGYRREAARIDKDMESKLLSSALARLDELPLRLVETVSHGSPLQELATSDAVKQALRVVPGFVDDVKALAARAVDAVTPAKSKGAEEG